MFTSIKNKSVVLPALALFMVAVLLFTMSVTETYAADNNPAGTTIDVFPVTGGDLNMETNYGTIKELSSGHVGTNEGIIERISNTGSLGLNTGTVTVNGMGNVITRNDGQITVNSGTVEENFGLIGENTGTVTMRKNTSVQSEITTNKGTVYFTDKVIPGETIPADGKIGTNNGNIYITGGTATIESNTGNIEVANAEVTVIGNAGTITLGDNAKLTCTTNEEGGVIVITSDTADYSAAGITNNGTIFYPYKLFEIKFSNDGGFGYVIFCSVEYLDKYYTYATNDLILFALPLNYACTAQGAEPVNENNALLWNEVSGKLSDGFTAWSIIASSSSENMEYVIPCEEQYVLPSTYSVEGYTSDMGSVTAEKSEYRLGETVKVTVSPENCHKPAKDETTGKALIKAYYYDTDTVYHELELTPNQSNPDVYTFTMPMADVTLDASFVKKYSVIKTAPTVKEALVYTGNVQALVTAGAADNGTMYYALGDDNLHQPEEGWQTSIPTGKDAGYYFVWYKSIGDEGYFDSEPDSHNRVTITIAKAQSSSIPVGLEAVKPSEYGKKDGKIAGTTVTMEYSKDLNFTEPGECFDCTASQTAGFEAGTYYVRFKATDNYMAGLPVKVIIPDGDRNFKNVTITGYSGVYDGSAHGMVLSNVPDGATVRYGNTEGIYDSVSNITYTDFTNGERTVYVEITKDGYEAYHGKATVNIVKSTPKAPENLGSVKPSAKGNSDGKITGTTSDMEYSEDADFKSATDCTAKETTGLKAGTYFVRIKETNNTNASESKTVIIEEGVDPGESKTVNIEDVEDAAKPVRVPYLKLPKIIGLGNKFALNVTNIFDNAKVKYTSSNRKIATIDADGVITAVGVGKCTVKGVIKQAGTTYKFAIAVTVRDTNKGNRQLKDSECLTPNSLTPLLNVYKAIGVNRSMTLNIKRLADNAVLTFSSEDESIATVSDKGVITGVKKGSTGISIYVRQDGYNAQFRVVVKVK